MGDLSRTVSESLGDFLQKWGIPAIPRPRINTVADDNFIFHENGRKLSKRVKNTVGKGEIARHEQFLLFPQCFRKACFPGASRGVIVWEWVNVSKQNILNTWHCLPSGKHSQVFKKLWKKTF